VFHFGLKRFCPECHSRDVRRSLRWGFLETCILPPLLTRPFRCQRCDTRFYGLVFSARAKGETPKSPIHGKFAKT
jgi:hypothetical protein